MAGASIGGGEVATAEGGGPKVADKIYAVMRMVLGFLFFCHGAQKIFGLFGGPHPDLPTGLVWFAGLSELIAGSMIAVGFLTTYAAFFSSGLMAFAYFLVHQGNALLPIENHGELATVYAWVFLYIAARGDGPWSLGGDDGGY